MSEKFVNSMETRGALTRNGAASNSSPDPSGETEGRISLFYMTARGLPEKRLAEYLEKSLEENILDTFLIAFHARDCRGGKGERGLGRSCLKFLLRNSLEKIKEGGGGLQTFLSCVAEYGRWDDLFALLEEGSGKPDFLGTDPGDVASSVFRFFSDQLKKDLENMRVGGPCTLAAKWAPTENCAVDRKYKAVGGICSSLKISKKNYRKTYISPLRSHIKIVERLMCGGEWGEIDYSHVPSCAMKKLRKAFESHDPVRFSEWKSDLELGKSKINAKQLYPHEIIKDAMRGGDAAILEAQWKVLVEETKRLGIFDRSVCVVDVSGSMGDIGSRKFAPIQASVSLGMIISECSEGPLKNKVITFHKDPKFCEISGETLKERADGLVNSPWGYNTDFQKIFGLILDNAKKHSLSQEDMPERLYILSDMQFDVAVGGKTNYRSVKDMYAENNYAPPKIIFWNLSGENEDFPCTVDDNETCMISGFSTSILKNILTLDTIDPYSIMRTTLDSERYDRVRDIFAAKKTDPEEKEKISLPEEKPRGWLSSFFG